MRVCISVTFAVGIVTFLKYNSWRQDDVTNLVCFQLHLPEFGTNFVLLKTRNVDI